jgi:hypothetical protein
MDQSTMLAGVRSKQLDFRAPAFDGYLAYFILIDDMFE